ncbi:MAG TPA: MFS transporter [Phycisphaerae bacterium]|nr:MFS transporter [Phycisphaerae bacterium]
MKSIIRSLRHRNFRLYFIGQSISVTGTWMQSVAMGWLVYRLTDSKILLGVVGFTAQILTFVVAPLAGVLADRWDRRRALIVAQTLAMAQALAMAAITLTGTVEVWHIIALSFFTGLVRGFEVPTRQSFIIQMLDDRSDLPNAIALNSFMVNAARLVGPLMAGGIIAMVGEGTCFLVNGVSYGAVIAALVAMRIAPRPRLRPTGGVMAGLVEGFAYARRTPVIRAAIIVLAVTSLVGVPYTTLMPVFARDILKGGPHTLGYLMGATGVGALVGAALLAARKERMRLGRMILLAAAAFGAGLIAFALAAHFRPTLWLSLPILVWVGCAMMVQMYSSNTLLQTVVDEDKRGRVMSFYTMAFMGVIPFGAVLAGWMAEHLGAPTTLVIGGSACLVGALVFGTRLPRLADPPDPPAAPAAA